MFVTVDKPFTDWFIDEMSRGVKIKDGMTKPCKVTRVESINISYRFNARNEQTNS